MGADELVPSHMSHRAPTAGPTMEKKSEIDKKKRGVVSDKKQQNPRVSPSHLLINVSKSFLVWQATTDCHLILQAFADKSAVKAKREKMRDVEKEQRRIHLPTIDRNYGDPPPFVVVVQGPPGVLCVLFRHSLDMFFFINGEVSFEFDVFWLFVGRKVSRD